MVGKDASMATAPDKKARPLVSPDELAAFVGRVPPTQFLSYRDFLGQLYQTIKAQRDSYSYHQFAYDLGFSKSNVLWLVISGKRKLAPKSARTLCASLGLSALARRYFTTMVDYNNAMRPDVREAHFQDLMRLKSATLPDEDKRNDLEYFSEWYFPVIREMVELQDFQEDAQWISDHLAIKIAPKQVEHALELLQSLGLLVRDPQSGRLASSGQQILPDKSMGTIAGARYLQQMCAVTSESVTQVPAHRREINSLTVRLTEEKAMKISSMLYRLCEEIMSMEDDGKRDDAHVYQVNLHLFAHTKERRGRKK